MNEQLIRKAAGYIRGYAHIVEPDDPKVAQEMLATAEQLEAVLSPKNPCALCGEAEGTIEGTGPFAGNMFCFTCYWD